MQLKECLVNYKIFVKKLPSMPHRKIMGWEKMKQRSWTWNRMILEWDGPVLHVQLKFQKEKRKELGKVILKKIKTKNFPEKMKGMAN